MYVTGEGRKGEGTGEKCIAQLKTIKQNHKIILVMRFPKIQAFKYNSQDEF